MTPAEEAVLAAARAYRDAHESGSDLVPLMRDLIAASMGLVDAPPVEAPTVAPARPWPDPEAYRALALQVFGDDGAPRDVGPAVIAWKALPDYTRVMCARGYQWTAHRPNGNLMFTQAKQDGAPGKTIEQPWYPLIMAKLPVWPIVVEADG